MPLPEGMLNPILLFGAVTPLLLILILMAGFRRSVVEAGAAAWGVTLLLVFLLFGGNLRLVIFSQARAGWMALEVLYIVWGALLFHAVCEGAGVVSALGIGISGGVRSRSLQVLALAWVFASFLQGAGGFGVPVVVTSPLLMAIGFPPVQAVVLPAIGHAWAVTFGSLGTSFQALMTASGLPAAMLAPTAALFLGVGCVLCGLLVGAMGLDRADFVRAIPVILLIGTGMGATQYILAVNGLWQIGSLGGGLAGLVIVFVVGKLLYRKAPSDPGQPTIKIRAGLAAYAWLIVVILAARLIDPIRAALQFGAWQPSFPQTVSNLGYTTSAEQGMMIAPFGHAGSLLIYSAAGAYILFSALGLLPRDAPRTILRRLFRAAVPVSLGILVMAGISTLMSHAGMMFLLAEGFIRLAGPAFPLLSPWIGALGAFLTGSNTNSNLLFTPLQQRMAGRLGLPVALLLAGQTGGGAVGSVLSPAKVIVGSGVAGGKEVEGMVMRRLMRPVAILLLALTGLMGLFAIWG